MNLVNQRGNNAEVVELGVNAATEDWLDHKQIFRRKFFFHQSLEVRVSRRFAGSVCSWWHSIVAYRYGMSFSHVDSGRPSGFRIPFCFALLLTRLRPRW